MFTKTLIRFALEVLTDALRVAAQALRRYLRNTRRGRSAAFA